MAYSPSQNRATQKYLKENKEQLRVWVSKGKLEKYKKWEHDCALLAVMRLCSGFDMTMSEKTCCDRAGFLSV